MERLGILISTKMTNLPKTHLVSSDKKISLRDRSKSQRYKESGSKSDKIIKQLLHYIALLSQWPK